jgi:hypothetical protein
MRSFLAVGLGVLISLFIGLLVTFGILWPIAMRFLSPNLADTASYMLGPLILVAAFAFYFGGMAAAYTASRARGLHGVIVPFASFALSPTFNVISGEGLFPRVNQLWEVVLILVFLAISAGAAFVGARRGESLYDFNQAQLSRRRRVAARREAEG